MIKEQVMQLAESTPEFERGMQAIEQQLERMPIVPEDMDDAIAMLEFVLQNPDKYAEVREAAIRDGMIDASMVPEEYDASFIVALLAALYAAQDRMAQKGFKRGGLTVAARKLKNMGRGGDSELVHVNPREKEMLRRMGGSGDINPNTGLQEYKSLKKIIGTVAPIAIGIFAPALLGTVGSFVTGGSLAAGTAGASALGGALIGGAGAALTGGNVLQGAALGGIGGYMGGGAGGAANAADDAMATGMGGAAQSAGEAGLTAAGRTGLQAPAGGFSGYGLNPAGAGQAAGEAALRATPGAAGQLASGLTSLATMASPAQSVLAKMQGVQTGAPSYDVGLGVNKTMGVQAPSGVDFGVKAPELDAKTAATVDAAKQATQQPAQQTASASVLDKLKAPFTGKNAMSNVMMAGLMANSLMQAPPQIQTAVGKLSPQQQEYFNRPSVKWDWNKIQQDAASSGMDVSDYMARNWNQITSGAYDVKQLAQGGALNAIARFAEGAGSGRDDTIEARLSDGEYVIDAETVAMLGDGSSKAGAQRLDQMRKAIRAHKGKALAKGKFSPDAKSPLAYLKGIA